MDFEKSRIRRVPETLLPSVKKKRILKIDVERVKRTIMRIENYILI